MIYPDWLEPSAMSLEALIQNHYRVIRITQHDLHTNQTIELPKPRPQYDPLFAAIQELARP